MKKEGKNAEVSWSGLRPVELFLIAFLAYNRQPKSIWVYFSLLMQQYGQIFPYFKYVILFELGTEQENNSDCKQDGRKKRKEQ